MPTFWAGPAITSTAAIASSPLDNLRHAFPGKYSERELDALVRKVYRHFCLMLMEILFLPRLVNASNWRSYLDYRSEEEAKRMMELWISGKPLLMVTGHFGNWEVSSYVLGFIGIRFCGIARPLDNPYLDDWMRRFREAQGQRILAKKGDFDQIQSVLAGGGVLGTLADQDAGQRGLYVDFFGRPASTHKAIALLALEHKVTIVVVAGSAPQATLALPGHRGRRDRSGRDTRAGPTPSKRSRNVTRPRWKSHPPIPGPVLLATPPLEASGGQGKEDGAGGVTVQAFSSRLSSRSVVVDLLDFQRVLLNELAARLDFFAHQDAEHLVGLEGIVELDLEERAA